jgi:SAM-dependent methyltransferase
MSPLFKCLDCGSTDLRDDDQGHACQGCRAFYPRKLGVSLFLKHVTAEPSGFEISEKFAKSICRLAGIEETSEKITQLREILRHNYHLSDLFLDAENNYYLDRVRAAIDEDVCEEGKRPLMLNRLADKKINEDIRAEFTAHYIPRRLTAGKTISHNVRFTNTGKSVISSDDPLHPVYLSYHWRNARGEILEWEGARTKLLIDVAPGQSLTMPMFFQTPRSGKPAYLELTMVHEGIAWMDDFSMLLSVEVVPEATDALPKHWRLRPAAVNYDYGEDHQQGQEILRTEIERSRQPNMRVLELGGCCNPMVERMGVEIVNIDIDVQTLQVGALRNNPVDRIHWVASDAHELPFADQSFHAIVIFAALHHFVDPIRVLRQLQPLLKKDGFLAIMCEPVGHNVAPPPEGMLHELNQGINEQAFSLQEYFLIFDQAGFEAYDLVAHGHSLKALLRPSSRPARTRLASVETSLPPATQPLRESWIDRLRSYWRKAG